MKNTVDLQRSQKSFYDSFWKDFSAEESETSGRAKLVKHFVGRTNITILDAGCGKGLLTYLISSFTKNNLVVGVDLSPSACRLAHKRINRSNVEFISADLAHLPFKESVFNFVTFSEVIEHIPFETRQKAVQEIGKTINKDGYLLLTMPNPLHPVIMLRKVLNYISIRKMAVSDQIYDDPPTLKGLFKLCFHSNLRAESVQFADFSTGIRIKLNLPKNFLTAIQVIAIFRPYKNTG